MQLAPRHMAHGFLTELMDSRRDGRQFSERLAIKAAQRVWYQETAILSYHRRTSAKSAFQGSK